MLNESSLKIIITSKSDSNYDKQAKSIIRGPLDKEYKIIALKGLKIQLQSILHDKLKINNLVEQQQSQSRILVIHQKNKSRSTNYSFDNMLSISQVYSVNEKIQKQMFDTMKGNYIKQIQKREQELIILKKERYLFTETLEDLQYDLDCNNNYLQSLKRELLIRDEEGKQMLQFFEKQKTSIAHKMFQGKIDNDDRFGLNKIKGFWNRKGMIKFQDDTSRSTTQQFDDIA